MKISRLFVCVLMFALTAAAAFAQTDVKAAPKNPLVGHWISEDDGTKVEIRANGSLTINGTEYAYKVNKSVINVIGEEGGAAIPFVLTGDTLTVEFEGREIVYKRVKPGAKTTGIAAGPANTDGGVMQALVGKWCYLANLTGNSTWRSSRCFVLNANGTYEYSSETSGSGANGSMAGQEFDSGRWSATQTTLTAFSSKHGKIVYPIELKNHPKNGDPMIVVDGDAYVTAYQKRPW